MRDGHRMALTWELSKRLVARTYRGSRLGVAWTMLNPLFMVLVYTVVFSLFLGFRVKGERGGFYYAVMILSGMIPFQVVGQSMMGATQCIRDNVHLVKRVIFPVEILPVSVVLSCFLNGLLGTVVLLVMVLIAEGTVHATVLFVPVVWVVVLLFATALSYFLAAAATVVRDVAAIVPHLTRALFFLTPVVWPLSRLPERYQAMVTLNPMAIVVLSHRNAVLYGEQPLWLPLCVMGALSVPLLYAGRKWFDMQKRYFPEVL